MKEPCVIVNNRNEYFWHWCAQFAPRYDGDDDSFVTVPEWTEDPELAYVFSSRASARNAAEKMVGHAKAVIGYSHCG
jgi:hypothetical protein